METLILITCLLVAVFLLSWYRRRPAIPNEMFLSLPGFKPNLYWLVDAEPNARHWWDFQGRRSDTPNRGYLEVALDRVFQTQSDDFNVVPLIGRMATMMAIDGAHPRAIDLPPALWRSYVISALCARRGGLVMDGNSVLVLGKSFSPIVSNKSAAMFGADHDEVVLSPNAISPGPDNYIGWAAAAGHPAWMASYKAYEKVVAAGAQAWTAAIARRMPRGLWEEQKRAGMECVRAADGSRLPDGSLRQLEDYFGRKHDVDDPKQAVSDNALYVVYDGDALERRFEFNWFLRLSKEQLKGTDLMWSHMAGLM